MDGPEVRMISHQARRDGNRVCCVCGWEDCDEDPEVLDALAYLHDLLFCDHQITIEENGYVL